MEYEKPFDIWNPFKQSIHKRLDRVLFNEREIWWCHVGINVGFEIDGKGEPFARPVLILRKFSRGMFLGIPFTSSERTGSWYVPVSFEGRTSNLVLSQIRVFDVRRLQRRIVAINETEFKQIKKQLAELLGLT